MAQTDRQTDRHGDSMTELGQLGRFSENQSGTVLYVGFLHYLLLKFNFQFNFQNKHFLTKDTLYKPTFSLAQIVFV